jgi:prepilin-type N-terminal cleavage/methylation domain-containing protein
MTLIEMLIAIVLTGIILNGAYKLLVQANDISRQHQQAALAGQRGWQTLRQLSQELQAVLPLKGDPANRLVVEDGQLPAQPALGVSASNEFPTDFREGNIPADTIHFATMKVDLNATTAGARALQYGLEQDDSGRVKGLFRTIVSPDDETGTTAPALHNPSAVAINYECMGQNGEWHPQWNEEALPTAIRITLWLRTSPTGEPIQVRSLRTVVHLPAAGEVRL